MCSAVGTYRQVQAVARHTEVPDSRAPSDALGVIEGRGTQAFGIGMTENGSSMLRGPITLRSAPTRPGGPDPTPAPPPMASRRIGLTKGADLPYRFYQADSRWVCPLPRTNPRDELPRAT